MRDNIAHILNEIGRVLDGVDQTQVEQLTQRNRERTHRSSCMASGGKGW